LGDEGWIQRQVGVARVHILMISVFPAVLLEKLGTSRVVVHALLEMCHVVHLLGSTVISYGFSSITELPRLYDSAELMAYIYIACLLRRFSCYLLFGLTSLPSHLSKRHLDTGTSLSNISNTER
jgi:hypothetical protein